MIASINGLYSDWSALSEAEYAVEKERLVEQVHPGPGEVHPRRQGHHRLEGGRDARTIERYTTHFGGTSFGTKFEGLKVSMDISEHLPGLYHAARWGSSCRAGLARSTTGSSRRTRSTATCAPRGREGRVSAPSALAVSTARDRKTSSAADCGVLGMCRRMTSSPILTRTTHDSVCVPIHMSVVSLYMEPPPAHASEKIIHPRRARCYGRPVRVCG